MFVLRSYTLLLAVFSSNIFHSIILQQPYQNI